MNALPPCDEQSVILLRQGIVEFLQHTQEHLGRALYDASFGHDRMLVDDFVRAVACFRAAGESVRELRLILEQAERAA
jgi:hypothetical protein